MSKRRYKVSTWKLKYISGIELAKAKLGIKTLEATLCDSLQADSVDGALLCDHNANTFFCEPFGKGGSKAGSPFLFTRLSIISMTLGPGSAAKRIGIMVTQQ